MSDEKSLVAKYCTEYTDLACAELYLDLAEKEGLAIARAELKATMAMAELKMLRAQAMISKTAQ